MNLFHVLSLLLVLGLGVDYAIILREGRNQQAVLAVFLSMTTTLISFGLLGFSSVPFVRSIGITVALGVAFTFLIALAARRAAFQAMSRAMFAAVLFVSLLARLRAHGAAQGSCRRRRARRFAASPASAARAVRAARGRSRRAAPRR